MEPETILATWGKDAQEMARLVIDKYGDPDEVTETMLVWHDNGEWKRTVVHREPVRHLFPKPHLDGVQQYIDYAVPLGRYDDLARFDGSVVAERTNGELSARCHDEEANRLALNLAHDIIISAKSVEEARSAYGQAMLDYRSGAAVPYMDRLLFTPAQGSADPDVPTLSDDALAAAENARAEA